MHYGWERRKTPGQFGRLIHCCCICGTLAPWGKTWSHYSSLKEEEEEVPIPKFCSAKCKRAGGENAALVTDEMKRRAKEAEWRPPKPTYHKRTYADAVSEQRAKTTNPSPPHSAPSHTVP